MYSTYPARGGTASGSLPSSAAASGQQQQQQQQNNTNHNQFSATHQNGGGGGAVLTDDLRELREELKLLQEEQARLGGDSNGRPGFVKRIRNNNNGAAASTATVSQGNINGRSFAGSQGHATTNNNSIAGNHPFHQFQSTSNRSFGGPHHLSSGDEFTSGSGGAYGVDSNSFASGSRGGAGVLSSISTATFGVSLQTPRGGGGSGGAVHSPSSPLLSSPSSPLSNGGGGGSSANMGPKTFVFAEQMEAERRRMLVEARALRHAHAGNKKPAYVRRTNPNNNPAEINALLMGGGVGGNGPNAKTNASASPPLLGGGQQRKSVHQNMHLSFTPNASASIGLGEAVGMGVGKHPQHRTDSVTEEAMLGDTGTSVEHFMSMMHNRAANKNHNNRGHNNTNGAATTSSAATSYHQSSYSPNHSRSYANNINNNGTATMATTANHNAFASAAATTAQRANALLRHVLEPIGGKGGLAGLAERGGLLTTVNTNTNNGNNSSNANHNAHGAKRERGAGGGGLPTAAASSPTTLVRSQSIVSIANAGGSVSKVAGLSSTAATMLLSYGGGGGERGGASNTAAGQAFDSARAELNQVLIEAGLPTYQRPNREGDDEEEEEEEVGLRFGSRRALVPAVGRTASTAGKKKGAKGESGAVARRKYNPYDDPSFDLRKLDAHRADLLGEEDGEESYFAQQHHGGGNNSYFDDADDDVPQTQQYIGSTATATMVEDVGGAVGCDGATEELHQLIGGGGTFSAAVDGGNVGGGARTLLVATPVPTLRRTGTNGPSAMVGGVMLTITVDAHDDDDDDNGNGNADADDCAATATANPTPTSESDGRRSGSKSKEDDLNHTQNSGGVPEISFPIPAFNSNPQSYDAQRQNQSPTSASASQHDGAEDGNEFSHRSHYSGHNHSHLDHNNSHASNSRAQNTHSSVSSPFSNNRKRKDSFIEAFEERIQAKLAALEAKEARHAKQEAMLRAGTVRYEEKVLDDGVLLAPTAQLNDAHRLEVVRREHAAERQRQEAVEAAAKAKAERAEAVRERRLLLLEQRRLLRQQQQHQNEADGDEEGAHSNNHHRHLHPSSSRAAPLPRNLLTFVGSGGGGGSESDLLDDDALLLLDEEEEEEGDAEEGGVRGGGVALGRGNHLRLVGGGEAVGGAEEDDEDESDAGDGANGSTRKKKRATNKPNAHIQLVMRHVGTTVKDGKSYVANFRRRLIDIDAKSESIALIHGAVAGAMSRIDAEKEKEEAAAAAAAQQQQAAAEEEEARRNAADNFEVYGAASRRLQELTGGDPNAVLTLAQLDEIEALEKAEEDERRRRYGSASLSAAGLSPGAGGANALRLDASGVASSSALLGGMGGGVGGGVCGEFSMSASQLASNARANNNKYLKQRDRNVTTVQSLFRRNKALRAYKALLTRVYQHHADRAAEEERALRDEPIGTGDDEVDAVEREIMMLEHTLNLQSLQMECYRMMEEAQLRGEAAAFIQQWFRRVRRERVAVASEVIHRAVKTMRRRRAMFLKYCDKQAVIATRLVEKVTTRACERNASSTAVAMEAVGMAIRRASEVSVDGLADSDDDDDDGKS